MDVEKTITPEALEAAIKTSNELAQREGVKTAIEFLTPTEKQSRLTGDAVGNSRVTLQMIELALQGGDLNDVEHVLGALTKKRALIKASVAGAVKRCIDWLEEVLTTLPEETRNRLTTIVRTVTEGKIYLEVERARITRILAAYLEKSKKLEEAAHVMQEVPVETFGSLERRSRIEFILEQMRLSLAIGEYQRAAIISRKITGTKTFETPTFEDLKIRYLELMVALALRDGRYADCWRHYRELYFNCPSINNPETNNEEDQDRTRRVLKLCCIFALLAPTTGEGRACGESHHPTPVMDDRLQVLMREKRLIQQLPVYADLLRTFLTGELVRWPVVERVFGPELRASFPDLFAQSPLHWQQLADRVLEHNVRIIARTYRSIRLGRLAELLERPVEEAEERLCSLLLEGLGSGANWEVARIDRLTGIVTFQPPLQPDALLNEWNSQVDSLLTLMVKTNYQIAKEDMMRVRTSSSS